MTRQTFGNALEAYFKAHEGQWIDGMALEAVAGRYAWRSRVSDLRTQRHMDIKNRQRKVQRIAHADDGHNVVTRSVTVSEYRYLSAPLTTEPQPGDGGMDALIGLMK